VEYETANKSMYLGMLSFKNVEDEIKEAVRRNTSAKSCILQPIDSHNNSVWRHDEKLKYIINSKHLCPLLKGSDEVKKLLDGGGCSALTKIHWKYKGKPRPRIELHDNCEFDNGE
jgi:hypothetical protein